MSHETHHDDLRAVFANPWVWLVTHGVFPLLTLASVAFCAWLLWGELTPEGKNLSIAAIAVPAVVAVSSLAAALACRRRNIPLWMSIASVAVGIAYLIGYIVLYAHNLLIPRGTPGWMVSPSQTLLVFAGMMPLILTDVWRIATVPLPLRSRVDAGLSLGVTVFVPSSAFLLVHILSYLGRASDWHLSNSLAITLIITLYATCPVLFFFAFLRSLMWVRLWFKTRAFQQRPWTAPALTLLVSVVLPIGGLLLNREIPFPADFQTPWVYLLTVLNAVFLILPCKKVAHDVPVEPECSQSTAGTPCATFVFLLRWLTFPFTLYFFLIFLPFFPLAILAMIAVGLGFLILAPVLLFWRHVTILAQDWRSAARPRIQKVVLAVLAASVIPAGILTNAYLDRLAFRKLLDYAFSPDITQDAALPASPARIRRILKRADAFKHQAETPILSAFYTQIVFDGLVLPDERFNFMWDSYVGELRDDEKSDGGFRDDFGSLFSRNNAKWRARQRRWGQRVPPPRNAAIESGAVQVAVSTNGYEQTVTLRLRITSPDSLQEFHAPVTLPSATWITGMRLKIDNEWQDASIIERRAAEWVYKQITTQRRDPAILTLETPERGLLRVFPVSHDLPRDLEITFLQPAGMSGEIKIGDKSYTVESDETLLKAIHADDTIFSLTQFSSIRIGHPWVVIDVSEKGLTPEQVQALFKGSLPENSGNPHIPYAPLHILLVNAETKTIITDSGNTPPRIDASVLLPNQFGLDAVRAVRQIEYQVRTKVYEYVETKPQFSHGCVSVHFVGDQWEALLPKIPAKDCGILQGRVFVTKSDGQEISVRLGDPCSRTHIYPKSFISHFPDHLLWTQGKQLWKLQQDCYDHGTLNANFRKILAESSRTGILVPQTAYIVVESEAQRKMLAVKQAEAANAHQALDFDYVKTDTPSLLVLAIGFGLVMLFRHWRASVLASRSP